ncbi:MAG TPA: response regulator [Thermoanaerobaculia bacterium]|nr:response regulator [Thermoanaerobaculia bacterium]
MAKILLIDDSEENRAAIEALLSDEGHGLEVVSQGRLAVSRARAAEPDLILIDLLLPGIPSWHLIRDLHRDPALIGVPILGVSPEAMGGARERALAAGCVAFIGVPICREGARGTIAHHLREREQNDITQTRPLAFGTPSIRTRPRARVLLASADSDFLHLYAATLRYRRYQVETVSSAAGILDRIDAERPHLVVLDRTLSDGPGVEASRRVKARQRDPFVPVLLLVDPGGMDAAIAGSGADDFLEVPFPEVELRHRVRSLLFLASAVGGERDRSRQLAAVARQMSIGLVLVDPEGRIMLMNQPSARILGVTPGELRGRSVRHLFRAARLRREDGSALAPDFDAFRRFRSAGQPAARDVYRLADREGGSPDIPVEIAWTAVVDGARKFRGAVVSARRLSDDAESQRALADAYDRLMEVDQLKSKFLSTVSHELRTPLNTIILLSHVLTSEPLQARPAAARERDLQIIRQSANALLHMINNLLDLARIEGGQAELSPEPVEIRRFLAETIEIIAPQAEKKKLPVRLAAGDDLPEWVDLDRDKTRQVLLNLLSNAVKFTQRGEVVLEVGRTPAGSLAFSVRDSGTGIPADKLPMIFEPFRQVAQGEAASAGSGLGLSIVKELVHLMGGEVTVTSRPGDGSTFRAAIPCRVASGTSAAEGTRPVPRPLRRPRILVVEDDQDSRYGLRTVLEMEGYEASEAATAAEAIAALSGGAFDAVFMDISLPDDDGTAVIRRIRSDPSTEGLPIVALTGKTSDGDRRKIDESGASAYLSKPVDVKNMLKTLASLLDGVETAAPSPAR